jgi:hypothetical protein
VCRRVKILMLSDFSDDGCIALVLARAREFMGAACQASPLAFREFVRIVSAPRHNPGLGQVP